MNYKKNWTPYKVRSYVKPHRKHFSCSVSQICLLYAINKYEFTVKAVADPGGSLGPPFCPFARIRRRPCSCARVQSKMFWTAEPPQSKS